MYSLIYAYDNNCLYWIENKLFLFILFIYYTEHGTDQRWANGLTNRFSNTNQSSDYVCWCDRSISTGPS
jgi:hypothetical protein